jgi:hypothetical protein
MEPRLQPICRDLLTLFVLHEQKSSDERSDRTVGHTEKVIDTLCEQTALRGRKGASVDTDGNDWTSGPAVPYLVHDKD